MANQAVRKAEKGVLSSLMTAPKMRDQGQRRAPWPLPRRDCALADAVHQDERLAQGQGGRARRVNAGAAFLEALEQEHARAR